MTFYPQPYPLYGAVTELDPWRCRVFLIVGWRNGISEGYVFPVLSINDDYHLSPDDLSRMEYSPDPMYWWRRAAANYRRDIMYGPGVPEPEDFRERKPAARARRSWDDLREERAAKPKGEYL